MINRRTFLKVAAVAPVAVTGAETVPSLARRSGEPYVDFRDRIMREILMHDNLTLRRLGYLSPNNRKHIYDAMAIPEWNYSRA